MQRELRIVFMGTPDFAVPSLRIIIENGYDVAAVITAPDKPAGRGRKLRPSPVKEFAKQHNINVLQPANLKDPLFIEQLGKLKANLFVVVAFRMLPESIWQMPEFGTFNLHASYLPQYRGAAPINRAIMNGETETGITTFFLQQEIDTGHIIYREKTAIGPRETAGQLHDRLMIKGASLVLKTLRAIETGKVTMIDQENIDPGHPLLKAPKIFKDECRINWNSPGPDIYNMIRGLSPYPTAFTELAGPDGTRYSLKIFFADLEKTDTYIPRPKLSTDGKTYLSVHTGNHVLAIRELQMAGKKKMKINDFLRGFQIDETFVIL